MGTKMKIVLFFFFLMSGIRSDLVIEDKEIVARFGRNGSPDAECKCKSYTDEAGGNCQTRYKGIRWCYLEEDKHEGCADLSGDPGSYWSWSACYPYSPFYGDESDCYPVEDLDQDDNRLV